MRVFASLLGLVFACTPDAESTAPGALIDVATDSRVAVVIDEFPAGVRDRAAALFLAKPTRFWEARARRQTGMTHYRLASASSLR